jgi:hypothetical protein
MLILCQISQSSLMKGHFQLSVELCNIVTHVLVTPLAMLKSKVCFFLFFSVLLIRFNFEGNISSFLCNYVDYISVYTTHIFPHFARKRLVVSDKARKEE